MQPTSQPLISIALCVYNGGEFLAKQLDSIIGQDYRNLEIVALDDCSNDDSWNLLKIYQEKDDRVKLYRNDQNLGYIKNFEKAIYLCSGRYFALADQDDVWVTDKISIMLKAIKNNIMVYHDSDYIDENGVLIEKKTVSSIFRMYEGSSCVPFILSNCVHGHATFFNSDIKKFIFPFDKRFEHDWWLIYVAFNVGTVKYINEVLVHYRQHYGTITDSLALKNWPIVENRPLKGIARISLDLQRLKYCADFKYNKEPALINRICFLLSSLADGKKRIENFWLLLIYFDLFFYIHDKQKNFVSRINFVRKICFN